MLIILFIFMFLCGFLSLSSSRLLSPQLSGGLKSLLIITMNGVLHVKCNGMTNRTVNDQIQSLMLYEGVNKGSISDGFHSFDELYEHRITLYIQLCKLYYSSGTWFDDEGGSPVWKSRVHSDGTMFNGWFILGINRIQGMQITYHLPDKYWDNCHFASTLSKAPRWDGHTSSDVLKRLKEL